MPRQPASSARAAAAAGLVGACGAGLAATGRPGAGAFAAPRAGAAEGAARSDAAVRAAAAARATVAAPAPAGAASAGAAALATAGAVAAAGAAARHAVGGRRAAQPRAPGRAPVALRAFENELGVQDPVGFWDPAGFAADGDLLAFKRRRCVELKHGRICMLACMGYITPEVVGKFPGYLAPSMDLKFADIPNGLAAVSKVPALGWVQMVAYAAYCELSGPRTRAANTSDYADLTPGDYGWKVLTSSDPAELTKKLNAEIANSRLAMVAILGMFFQDGLTGSAWGDWANYVDSPLRAFENELGVQEPVGFWDPLGFTSDGDVSSFKRRRTVELKHGRISMLATMGYITPELTGKFPGYISNSLALKFDDIPSGLAAISKVPALGWAQVVAYCGFCELSAGSEDWKSGTPGDYGFKVLTSSDPAEKEKKLAAEIANGRLAMVAIIGMFFQDGLTGTAWGDWALYTASPLRFFGGDIAPAYKTFDPATELGVQEPLGFWDPLGFTSDNDEAAFKRRRSVELKHGRVCMAASIGYIVPNYYTFPGFLSPSAGVKFADVPNGLAALGKVPALGWVQIIFFAGIVEGAFGFDDYKSGAPGDYGWKVLTSDDPAEKDKKLAAELANGRLAMVATIGMFFQDGLTGSAWGDWALYTASPLRAEPVSTAAAAAAAAKAAAAGKAATKTAAAIGAAAGTGAMAKGGSEGVAGTDTPKPEFDPAVQIGAMAPLGYFDPAGFCKKGDESGFRTFRAAEIKHGRVAMMAAVGGVAQHYIKFPGFEGVPSGLAAVLTPPGSYGMVALFAAAGALELGAWTEDPSKEPGNFGDPVGLNQYTEEMRSREINNGRFAMFAALGIISAELLTGKDAVEQLGL